MGVNEPEQRLRVAMVVADEREAHGTYDRPEPYFGPAPAALLSGFSQLDGVEIHIVSCVRRPVVAPSKIAANIYYHTVRVPPWGYLKTFYVPTILRIRQALRKINPAVVHGQGTERYYALAAAFSGFPSVITIHGNMRAVARALHARPFTFHWLTAHMEAVAARRAGGVICLSNYSRREVADLARKTWVLHNPVPDDFFAIQPELSRVPRLLCVGLICPYKNQNALIRTLDGIAKTDVFKLAFAGPAAPGPYEREFHNLIAERPWCEYLGVLDRAALQKELSSATCLVHPSLEDNCPMVILEAMAAGLPVIGSRCGGIPDLIEPAKTGFLCDAEKMSSFAVAVETVLRDPKLGLELGANAKRRANEEFRPASVAARHLPIYRELFSARSGRPAS